jgi:hypothetical protein
MGQMRRQEAVAEPTADFLQITLFQLFNLLLLCGS